MSKSKNRNRKPRPRLPENALADEANRKPLVLTFRGAKFSFDVADVDWGKAAFAIKMVERETAPLGVVAMMMDAIESAVGQENLKAVYEVAPDLFSTEAAQREFWEAFAQITIEAPAGESLAS